MGSPLDAWVSDARQVELSSSPDIRKAATVNIVVLHVPRAGYPSRSREGLL
jgi:hypothetical protein